MAWNRTMLNLCVIVVAILKMATLEIFQCREWIRDIIIYPHMKCRWNRTIKIQQCPISSKFDMWVDNDVPNWFPTLKYFYRSPFSKWPPQYRKNNYMKFFNIRNQFGTSLSTHISNCDDIGQCWIFAVLWRPFWKWRPVEIVQCRESIPRIDSRHWSISTGCHFQNALQNIAKIQHCPISSQFNMWVDNDVPNWFPILSNFY
jgi:hypothetical protein